MFYRLLGRNEINAVEKMEMASDIEIRAIFDHNLRVICSVTGDPIAMITKLESS